MATKDFQAQELTQGHNALSLLTIGMVINIQTVGLDNRPHCILCVHWNTAVVADRGAARPPAFMQGRTFHHPHRNCHVAQPGAQQTVVGALGATAADASVVRICACSHASGKIAPLCCFQRTVYIYTHVARSYTDR